MSRKLPLAAGQVARTATARVMLRGGVVERTGELLSARVVAERVGWAADLVAGMATVLLAKHWNAGDVARLAGGVDDAGRTLPSNAWMALRRLGWGVTLPEAIRVNDRIVRMAQEQAGRILRGAQHRAEIVAGIVATWPADPNKRILTEWDAVREAIPDGKSLPSSVIKARTRQITAFTASHGRLPIDVFELEDPPNAARMLVLAAVDRQQATLQRSEDDPSRVLLRLQLPTCPDPRSYADWTWVACPLTQPPIVPPDAVLHLPTLRPTARPGGGGRVHADLAFSHPVPKAEPKGHTTALGVDWGLNTLRVGRSSATCGIWPPRSASPWSPSRPVTLRSTARSVWSRCGIARHPTGPPRPGGSGRSAPTLIAAGKATGTMARGGASPPAA